jgi:hypothetical protein
LFPQARKHCRNGDAGTDCDWDNTQNETEKKKAKQKVEKTRKARETQKGKENRVKKAQKYN